MLLFLRQANLFLLKFLGILDQSISEALDLVERGEFLLIPFLELFNLGKQTSVALLLLTELSCERFLRVSNNFMPCLLTYDGL